MEYYLTHNVTLMELFQGMLQVDKTPRGARKTLARLVRGTPQKQGPGTHDGM